jgi:hypothetical protein
MNRANIQKVIDVIEAVPSCWNQAKWHCGTQHCFAGHAQILSGKTANDTTVRQDARVFLDLDLATANWAFSSNRTLEDFKTLLVEDDYDCDGYARDGYNRDGYARDGYNCDGYNRDGHDRDGYALDGYDRDGLDRNNKLKS